MLAALRTWWSGSSVPTAAEMQDVLDKIDRLRRRFPADKTKVAAHDAPRLDLIDAELAKLKTDARVDAIGKVDANQWNALTEADRRQLAPKADQLFDDVKCLTYVERRIGRIYFVTFAVLFVAVAVVYVGIHRDQWKKRTPPTDGVTDGRIIAAATALRLVESEPSTQRGKKPAKDMTEAERKVAIAAIVDRVGELKTAVEAIDLSFNTLQLLGTVAADAQSGALLDNTDSVTKLRAPLLADLESRRSGFFWSDRVGRWFEIAWWAEIGVLVGILFYIAGILGEGRFESEDIAMMWTEVAIAPVVVLVIFFLFALTGITGISPSETALSGNIGFAFIFGFAIRRTLGLLDTIKKRIFPDPSP
jgi:hypothetical protein